MCQRHLLNSIMQVKMAGSYTGFIGYFQSMGSCLIFINVQYKYMFLSRRLLSALERTHKKVQEHLSFIQGQTTCLPPPFLFFLQNTHFVQVYTYFNSANTIEWLSAWNIFFFYNFKVLEGYSYIIIAYCDVHMYSYVICFK